ncbi:ROK family protein [Nonomuraea dietziae]|uniref:ROK family protein n=1 Tax=Nonomuraea dietziae TaxID=65515 RepID=UPI003433AA3B
MADSGERECSCGSRGCLETVAGGAALARRLRERGLPSMTQSLSIEAGIAGPDAALTGLGHLVRAKADVRSS